MKKCFGIISWLPENEEDRKLRIARVNRFLKQINSFWPDIDILVIAQNWKKFKPVKISNKIIKVSFDSGLGILKARKVLREEFLKLDYDFLIMFDDDTIIEETEEGGAKKYINKIDNQVDGFGFLQYEAAQLSGCAISKEMLKKEDIPNVDPQKGEAFEDCIYSNLLHILYSNKEFKISGIKCTQFQNPNEVAKSTWYDEAVQNNKTKFLCQNTAAIIEYLKTYKQVPSNYLSLCREPEKKIEKSKSYLGYTGFFGI